MKRPPPVARRGAIVMLLGLATTLFPVGIGGLGAVAYAAEAAHVKVAIIVGPAGSVTGQYRALADEAAATARRRSDRVVTVYSPYATWPAVKRALDGASVVVYLGHGNGWPSPYRGELYPLTQNGLGLNPVAGGGDDAHQYFGESFLKKSVHLAPGAVVVMSHLCYASGNPEPGGPEPTLSVASQRAENYGAGWMGAGASAVIAEAHSGPAYYVDAVLRGAGTIERIWRSAPTFHGHVIGFASARTDGVSVLLDPDRADRGYNRSLSVRGGLRALDVLRSAPSAPANAGDGSAGGAVPTGVAASLARLGARFTAPQLSGPPVAGAQMTLRLPIGSGDRLPKLLSVGTRWDPVSGVASVDPKPTRVAAADLPRLVADPPEIDLVEPEVAGSLVTTARSARDKTGVSVAVALPTQSGLYRLVTTIHDADGIAYDAETQALIPALFVQVIGPMWASYGVPALVDAAPGQPFTVRVRVANTGTESWGVGQPLGAIAPNRRIIALPPQLLARWLDLIPDITGASPEQDWVAVPTPIDPGTDTLVELTLTAPTRSGGYLLVLDTITSDGQSLAGLGVPPGLIRVTVGVTIPSTSPAPSGSPALPTVDTANRNDTPSLHK